MIPMRKVCIASICFLLPQSIVFGVAGDIPVGEEQEWQQDMARIHAMDERLLPGPVNSLSDFEEFADEIQAKWELKSRDAYARLMLAVCAPLSSGRFSGSRHHEVARRYALSAIEKPEEVSLVTELELTGHVVTRTIGPAAPTGEAWEEIRRKNVEVHLHAWRRLLDSIDPNWDPNERIPSPNAIAPPTETGLPGGVDPQAIENPVLRAEYEQAIDVNRRRIEEYIQQYRLRQWLRRYPRTAERHITLAYSTAPYNNEELTAYLDQYRLSEGTKTRILDRVTENIARQEN